MKYIFSILVICIATQIRSQIKVSEKTIDYLEIGPDTDLEKEIYFVNTGSKESRLLTNDFPREYDAHVSSKIVAPGDTLYLRWKFSPVMKGGFNDNITIWFSTMDVPLEVKIKGKVKYIDPYGSPACPNFNQRPAGYERTFLTEFIVREEGSEKRIKNAQIKLVDRGVVQADLYTDRNGEETVKLPIRYFYFLVEAEGYEPADLYSYVNSKNHRFIFDLVPLPPAQQIETVKEELEIISVEECDEEVEEIIIVDEPVNSEPDDLGEFSLRDYRPNNIVFLVDVSGSMNTNGRMDILKAAMIEMVKMMRPEDRISLVSYARNANVLLAPTSGSSKDEIVEKIRGLTPQGATNGEKGLKRAYATAKSSFIPKGNNRVYIATDGVFRVSEIEAIDKLVKKNSRRKIYLSVLGIKGTVFTKKKMSELALEGNGTFIDMDDFESSAEKLKELIKLQSFKKHH